MGDKERPAFIKPEEQPALIGYPRPGNKAQKARLEEQSEIDKQRALEELVRAGRLRLGDVHDMMVEGVNQRNNRHQDPSGLDKS